MLNDDYNYFCWYCMLQQVGYEKKMLAEQA